MNSIIEAQITLKEELGKEYDLLPDSRTREEYIDAKEKIREVLNDILILKSINTLQVRTNILSYCIECLKTKGFSDKTIVELLDRIIELLDMIDEKVLNNLIDIIVKDNE